MVELAKALGTWTALDDVENLVEPPDLATALNAHPEARKQLGRLPAVNQAGHPGVDQQREAAGDSGEADR
jgi:uncharacterized protein YdeI (YjbR/CyaY-like superfamily)